MAKMLDYLVATYDGSFDTNEVEQLRKELLKEHSNIELIEVKSVYHNEKGIVFCTEQVDEETALKWFEKEQDKFYGNEE